MKINDDKVKNCEIKAFLKKKKKKYFIVCISISEIYVD